MEERVSIVDGGEKKKSKKKKGRPYNEDEGISVEKLDHPKTMPQFQNKFADKQANGDYLEVFDDQRSSKKKRKNKRSPSDVSGNSKTIIYEDEDDPQILEILEAEAKAEMKIKKKKSNYIKDHRRDTLPALRPKQSINIFKILKDALGKDLSKFCVPVYFNEPISMLQKVCEMMQNERLVTEAANQTDSLLRLVYVTAFCIAQYGGTQFRCTKPFNPILGETYEFKTKKWKFFGEQVSHHPPITAGHAESSKYELWMNTHLKSKFWGKSLEFTPLGAMNFRFKDNDHLFKCKRPMTTVQNIIIGTMYIDHKGDCIVENTTTGEAALVSFKPMGMFSGNSKRGIVSASIRDSHNKEVYELYGKWTEALYYKPSGASDSEGILLWEFPRQPEDWERIYHFTEFTLQLNMVDGHILEKLPPTDSRLRPDQRCLENGDLQLANDEKRRLEDRQRDRLRKLKEEGIEYEPRYFEKEEHENEVDDEGVKMISYKYKGGYWTDRKSHNWEGMPDLFGYDE